MPIDVSEADTRRIGDALRINWAVVPPAAFRVALGVELEHADVTGGDLMTTGRIALAHLREDPDYYTRHARIEAEAEAYWSTRTKPSPTLGGCGGGMIVCAALALILLLIIVVVCARASVLASLQWPAPPRDEQSAGRTASPQTRNNAHEVWTR